MAIEEAAFLLIEGTGEEPDPLLFLFRDSFLSDVSMSSESESDFCDGTFDGVGFVIVFDRVGVKMGFDGVGVVTGVAGTIERFDSACVRLSTAFLRERY